MIKVELAGEVFDCPTNCSEVKLGNFIEFQRLYDKYKDDEVQMKLEIVKAFYGIDGSIIANIKVGEFDDTNEAIETLILMAFTSISDYEPSILSEGYTFNYEGVRYSIPIYFTPQGVKSGLTYGQYIEAKQAIKMFDDVRLNDIDGSLEFTSYLMILASLARPVERFDLVNGLYVYRGEDSLIEYRAISENPQYWQNISMKDGMDAYFFFQNLKIELEQTSDLNTTSILQ